MQPERIEDMNGRIKALSPPKTAQGDVSARRVCLRCRTVFLSEGFSERICKRCKSSGAWKNAAPSVGNGTRGTKARSSGSES